MFGSARDIFLGSVPICVTLCDYILSFIDNVAFVHTYDTSD